METHQSKIDKAPVEIRLLDTGFPESQQLPRNIEFCIKPSNDNPKIVITYNNDMQVGDPLTDNAYEDDGYRYHDVFHISYLAVLGWSPVLRRHLNRKRKNNLKVDEVEDGGRAIVIEEGVAALIYSYAKERNWLENATNVDNWLLKTIKGMTDHLEIKIRTEKQWEDAILQGYDVWRDIRIHKQGLVTADMIHGKLTFAPFSNDNGE